MNICLLSREYPPETGWGGIGTYTYHLAHGLAEKGHQVHVIAQGLEKERVEQDEKVTVHRVFHRPLFVANGFLREWGLRVEYSYHVLQKVKEVISKYSIDIVEAPNFSGEGFGYSFFKRTPLVTRLHTHFSEAAQFLDEGKGADHYLSCVIEDAAILRSDLVICSTKAHSKLVSEEIGMNPDRVERIPLGIPLPSLNNDHGGHTLELPHPAILFVGRLEKRKGIHTLMQSIPIVLKETPQAHFFIVGRDTYVTDTGVSLQGERRYSFKEKLLQEFPQEYLDRVHFVGYVSNELLERYYQSCDFFVAPSLYESFGFIYVEAMSYGKPVIGCCVGGVPEVVENGVTGILVPPEDPARLAQEMIRLLKDSSFKQELGRQARKRVEVCFTREIMVENTLRAYRRLL